MITTLTYRDVGGKTLWGIANKDITFSPNKDTTVIKTLDLVLMDVYNSERSEAILQFD